MTQGSNSRKEPGSSRTPRRDGGLSREHAGSTGGRCHHHLFADEFPGLLDYPGRAALAEECAVCSSELGRVALEEVVGPAGSHRGLALLVAAELHAVVARYALGRHEYRAPDPGESSPRWGGALGDDPAGLLLRVERALEQAIEPQELPRIDAETTGQHLRGFLGAFLDPSSGLKRVDEPTLVAFASAAVARSHPGRTPWRLTVGFGPGVLPLSVRVPLYVEPAARIVRRWSEACAGRPIIRMVSAADLAALNGRDPGRAVRAAVCQMLLCHEYLARFAPEVLETLAHVRYDLYDGAAVQRKVIAYRTFLRKNRSGEYSAAVRELERFGSGNCELYALHHLAIFEDDEARRELQVSLGGSPERVFNAFRRIAVQQLRDRSDALLPRPLPDAAMLAIDSFERPVYLPAERDLTLGDLEGGESLAELVGARDERAGTEAAMFTELTRWRPDLVAFERFLRDFRERWLHNTDRDLPAAFLERCTPRFRARLTEGRGGAWFDTAALMIRPAGAAEERMDIVDYNHANIEKKWQQRWREQRTFKTANPGDAGFDASKPKYYVLDMFPYPSGDGLHVGHPEGYTATDIIARVRRMQGFNVLHPMGWDAFGLPAEEFARDTGQQPAEAVERNVANFRRQIEALGLSYDWDRELSTTDRKYYRWTQWIFLKLWGAWFDEEAQRARPIAELPIPPELAGSPQRVRAYRNARRLAYQEKSSVWWCDDLGTVMAEEEVNREGRTVDKGLPCGQVLLHQWKLRITAYAERLLAGLATLDWPDSIKAQQRNWIGRSEGATVRFEVDGTAGDVAIDVFTTRPDTIFGATFLVVSPEHPLVDALTTPACAPGIETLRQIARARSERDRISEAPDVGTGAPTGACARNPATDELIPVFVADYVLMTYGTGAIMAVPAHDQRDFTFAQAHGLPVRLVVQPTEGALTEPLERAFDECGVAVGSPWINGLPTDAAKTAVIAELEARGLGARSTRYRMRDWLFSRQRYWGEPFPLIHTEDGDTKAIREEDLPLELPMLRDFAPRPGQRGGMLGRVTEWIETVDPETGRPARRDSDTMPGWAGSCWYYLRFTDAHNDDVPWRDAVERYWMPVDLYVGGAEHAVLHLLYARFWHQALYDLGHVSTPEPFRRLFNQGLILSYVAEDANGKKVPMDQVLRVQKDDKKADKPDMKADKPDMKADKPDRPDKKKADKDDKAAWVHKVTNEPLEVRVGKMSKSMKNVVNPDEIVSEYGADTLRLYEMSMGALEDSKPWNTIDLGGSHRLLKRVFRMIVGKDGRLHPSLTGHREPDPALEMLLHQTVKAVSEDIEALSFNTAIARLTEYVNAATKRAGALVLSQAERFVLLLSPFAPHVGEELWERLGHSGTLAFEPWPRHDAAMLERETVEYAVQVDGRVRGRFNAPMTASPEELERRAREAVEGRLGGGDYRVVETRAGAPMISLVRHCTWKVVLAGEPVAEVSLPATFKPEKVGRSVLEALGRGAGYQVASVSSEARECHVTRSEP